MFLGIRGFPFKLLRFGVSVVCIVGFQEFSVVGSSLDYASAGFQCFVGAGKELAPDT